ncbi:hypothetical protein FCV25MIE_28749 [Fagus crenata]
MGQPENQTPVSTLPETLISLNSIDLLQTNAISSSICCDETEEESKPSLELNVQGFKCVQGESSPPPPGEDDVTMSTLPLALVEEPLGDPTCPLLCEPLAMVGPSRP